MSLRMNTVAVLAAAVVLLTVVARQPFISGFSDVNTNGVPGATRARSDVADNRENGEPTPVLVELFTSEGCSSCPPADALLSRLGRKQPVHGANVIVLEEHVNYWDGLGWKDPFSSEAATTRQGDYGDAFGGKEVYTPQMIVDGHAELVGSSESDALRAIRAAVATPKPAVHLAWNDDSTLAIRVEPLTDLARGDTPQVFLAITESMLRSDVKRGENAGRALVHDGVVRQLLPAGKIDNPSSEFSLTIAIHPAGEWNRANLRAVVFVQEKRSRHVLAASAISFYFRS